MGDPAPPPAPDQSDCLTEVVRLNKIVRSLMDRAERSTSAQASDFSLFQTTVILEEQVRGRTAELEAALRDNERMTRAVRESEAKFRALVSQSMVGIVIIEDGKFTYSNAKFDEIFGYSAEEVRRLGPLDVAVEEDRPLVAEMVRVRATGDFDRVEYVFRGLRKSGEVADIEIHGSGLDIGGKVLLISLVMDITERVRTEHEVQALQDRLREESTHDALTGLYNRRYLEDTLGRELIRAEREGYPISVIMGDLDHFKDVNDRHGHLAGDEVLRIFGELMKQYSRGSDIYCRYGGEEFLLVLPKMSEEDAVRRAEQLRKAIAAVPISFGPVQITVTASFGVATSPNDGRTSDELIAKADDALYEAKTAGRNRVNASTVQTDL
jgi:diguanylate cyclase (GGDEF)-like protein/PAS domain S-box-containing protein